MNFRDLLLWVAQLATLSESGRDPEFRQDISLKQKPDSDNQQKPPDPH